MSPDKRLLRQTETRGRRLTISGGVGRVAARLARSADSRPQRFEKSVADWYPSGLPSLGSIRTLHILSRLGAGRARLSALFVEREVFLRSDGRVRFLRISRTLQIRVAAATALALLLWALATAVMIGFQAKSALDGQLLARAQAEVAKQAAANAAFRDASGNVAQDLVRRQKLIEDLVTERLGQPGDDAPKPAAAGPAGRKLSALPDAQTLAGLAARQDAFAAMLAGSFDARSAAAAATLRRLGFNPATELARRRGAQGGPLLPLASGVSLTPALRQLAGAVERWSVLQDNLVAIPSAQPTAGTPVTSSYGVRSDPFTGEAAFHAGLDFIGAFGQPIQAAAPGRVVFVGQKAGYGNVVEIDHGHELVTRYAHLSSFAVRPGQEVERGARIAGMGSTGRSTGTHLHFEVRRRGEPLNPRRFLSVAREIADVQ